MNKNILDEAVDKEIDEAREELAKTIKDIDSKIIDENVTKMNINVFEEAFLPLFKSGNPDTEPVVREKWLMIAGSANKEVVLVDGDGNEVKRVPPLLNTVNTSETIQAMKLADVAGELERNKESGKGFMNKNIEKQLFNALNSEVKPASNKWGDFLDSFGKDEKPTSEAVEDGFDY